MELIIEFSLDFLGHASIDRYGYSHCRRAPPGLRAGLAVVQALRLVQCQKMEKAMAQKQRGGYNWINQNARARRVGRKSPPPNTATKATVVATEIKNLTTSSPGAQRLGSNEFREIDNFSSPEKVENAEFGDGDEVGPVASDPANPDSSKEISVSTARTETKRAQLIRLLESPQGASVPELSQSLRWLPHTVRAALTGLRREGREVSRHKDPQGRSVYRLSLGVPPLSDDQKAEANALPDPGSGAGA